jgi:cystathionine gamma-synthase
MDRGFGGMMSLRVKGGFDAAHKVALATKVFVPATSLGGVESLIEHRTVLEPPESVVPDDLLRLSIGIEPVDELIADLEQALG